MKIGCVAAPGEIGLAASLGYDYIELSGRDVCAMQAGAFKELGRALRDAAIPCLGFNAYCPPEVRIAGPGFAKGAARSYAQKGAERAAELGVRMVGVGSPMSRNLPEGFSRELAMSQAAEFFAATGEVFAPLGITVGVEALGPCYCNFINRLHEAHALARRVGLDNVKLVVDFYNMEHSGETDILLKDLVQDIAHCHISDDAGRPDRRWFLKPEKADIHAARLNGLYALGYTGAVTVEIDLPLQIKAAAETLRILRGARSSSLLGLTLK